MQMESPRRIRPARWFRHALSARDLVSILEARARALKSARDPRAAFCSLRALQAMVLRDAVERRAFGRADAWIERLEIERAHRYLRALDGWDRGEMGLLAAPWRTVFSLRRHDDVSGTATLEIGQLVHDGYDLPLALAQAGHDARYGRDVLVAYATLGELYAASVERAQRRALQAQPQGCGEMRPHIAGVGAQALRERWGNAWLDAEELLAADDASHRQVVFARIETAALCGVRALVHAMS